MPDTTVRYNLKEKITIRVARPSDACDFIDTWEEVSREDIYLIHDHAPRTVSEQEKLIRYIDRDKNTIVVAELNRKVVGGMCIFIGGISSKCASFCNLGLHIIKSARGRGVGRQLLSYGIDWATAKGYHKICLSVFSTNTRAISLYEKLGFIHEGLRKEQYILNGQWIDELLMARFL